VGRQYISEQGAENNIGKGTEVRIDWRKLHNEQLHNLYSKTDINRIIKSKTVIS
jgi:hypothetical protein